MSIYTPRRSLARPRPANNPNGIGTASTPNLGASYSSSLQSPRAAFGAGGLAKKGSLNALTSGSLATIPDASEEYPLSTVLDEDSLPVEIMLPWTPRKSAGGDDGEIEVGDLVDVPGNMYGTVKFIGNVEGKKGTFAGVELSEEFAKRGKNSGDVDG